MKKILSVVLYVLSAFMLSMGVFAANGDVAGEIYSTDIRTCINGVWVDSYNIGGKTVVVVEDITNQFSWSDELRTLIIQDFAPDYLVEGINEINVQPGKAVGNIYETDIKTYFRGKELTSYSLDGKMAIVVEELGEYGVFSDIGGKYSWNPANRTLILESMYRYPYKLRTLMEEKNYNIILKEENGALIAELTAAPLNGGYILYGEEVTEGGMMPVKHNGEIIGYKCNFRDNSIDVDENGVYSLLKSYSPVEYFYIDKFEDMIFKSEKVEITAEDWLNYFKNHTISTVYDSFETDNYIFLYMHSSYVMSGSDRLIKINKYSGHKTEYNNYLDSNNRKKFKDLKIDKENEKVYFEYGRSYVLNLKTDELIPYEKVETDMGFVAVTGELSEYNSSCARNDQHEYRLIYGEDEKIVSGCFSQEYYYAEMLPLSETFDFFNIKYSFENDILTIDTSEAKPFNYERLENKADALGEESICYMYVDKVILNGAETQITYPYISGHFQNTYEGRAEAKPYVCNGKVYINSSFISLLFSEVA